MQSFSAQHAFGNQAVLRFGVNPLSFDNNPAQGVMNRAHLHAQQFLQQQPAAKQPGPDSEPLSTSVWRFLVALDRAVVGDATQSFGLHMYGSGSSSKRSTATRPTKDAVYLTSTGIDLEELFDAVDAVLVSISTMKERFTTWKDFKSDPVKVLFELEEKIRAIKSKLEEERRKAGKPAGDAKLQSELLALRQELGKVDLKQLAIDEQKTVPVDRIHLPTLAPPAKEPAPKVEAKPAPKPRVEVGQWVAYDLSGNMYIKIKYSDGTTRFLFASIFGSKDIGDPGDMGWRKVR